MKAVEIKSMSLAYQKDNYLFRDFNLDVYEGETVALFGDSGVGKSTILSCISGIIPGNIKADLSGEVLVFGKPVSDYTRLEMAKTLGVVFQNPDTQLFCDTVEDEIAFGLENLCMELDEMAEQIDRVLSLIGLERYRKTSPSQLSGGQKQLVVLAAVIAMQPKVLLLDESLSQLDFEARQEMLAVFSKLKEKGQTIVMVDHDELNLSVEDRVVTISPLSERGEE